MLFPLRQGSYLRVCNFDDAEGCMFFQNQIVLDATALSNRGFMRTPGSSLPAYGGAPFRPSILRQEFSEILGCKGRYRSTPRNLSTDGCGEGRDRSRKAEENKDGMEHA